MRYLVFLVLALIATAQTVTATTPQDQREVRFSLVAVEERCAEPTADAPNCYHRLTLPQTKTDDTASVVHTVERDEFPIHETMSAGSAITVATCSKKLPLRSWDLTFHEWRGNEALVDIKYEQEEDCEKRSATETRISRQLILSVPGQQRVGETIRTTVEGEQRIVTSDYVILIAEPEP